MTSYHHNGAGAGVHQSLMMEEERVTFAPHANHPNRFVPTIFVKKPSGVVTTTRKFEATDMARVLDFEELAQSSGRVAAVRDECILVGDFEGDGTQGIAFPQLYVVLRGGFLFCLDPANVGEGAGRYTTFEAPPVCVIPLEQVSVQFPAGGRRVFREHAHTAAQSGYEFILQHTPPDNNNNNNNEQQVVELRPPAFLVVDSLSKRNKWKEAIEARAALPNKPTMLRAGYAAAAASASSSPPDPIGHRSGSDGATTNHHHLHNSAITNSGGGERKKDEMLTTAVRDDDDRNNNKKSAIKTTNFRTTSRNARESKSMEQKILEVSDDADLAAAVVEFGSPEFDETEWMNKYYTENPATDAAATCEQMEAWLLDMKKSLKGAVLEQYEYFVQASGEMTTMGREVASLKTRIETQVDTLKEMKEIDFLAALKEAEANAQKGDEIMNNNDNDVDGDDDSEVASNADTKADESYFGDELGEIMNKHRGLTAQNGTAQRRNSSELLEEESSAPPIEVPDWLEDVDEEIAAIVRECRYNAAIELYLKATTEIADLLDKHERPTAYRLTRKQLDDIRALKKTLKQVGQRISARLEESLRRKNEALRQACKRERSDPSSALVPLVSPCALNDDALYLQLLVKLGRTQEAAEAFASRRSLLLLETLQEKPMSGAGNVDLVIYAAQLSQSFFSCLANSVEGFLDLFLMATPVAVNGDKSEDSDASSLHSHSLGTATKNLPAGAVASLVLWCDSELSKFAIAFGGSRILSNLALSPPTRGPKGPRIVGDKNDITKERKNAIEVAAQCIDQAFLYASQNLDSVGLPLTPRLAEMVRVRLKGCEQEVSELVDERWHTLTQDWRNPDTAASSY